MPKVNSKDGLTFKQRKFVQNKIKGQNNTEAYLNAGYKASKREFATVEASKTLSKPNVQLAIDKALEAQGATPEFAVGILKQVADQQEEVGARRLAAKDILELHGWRKGEVPNISISMKNAFFTGSRNSDYGSRPVDRKIVEAE